jgi:kumamolisin
MPTIAGSELIHLPASRAVGTPATDEVIRVSVILHPKAPLPLPAVGVGPLTREQFAATYGADPAAIAKVENFARQYGLTVVESSAARRTVVLSGTIAVMATAFGVRFANYSASGATYRGYEGGINIPDELAAVVVAVHGLDNRPAAEPRFAVAQPADLENHEAGGPYTPVEVATAYAFPTTSHGNGQCIGIIELGGGFRATDLQTFFGGLDLPVPEVVVISVDGATNSPGVSDADYEVGLDIQVAGAVAPQAKIAVYFAPNTFDGFLDAINTAVLDTVNQPSVISISWGQSEDSWPLQSRNAFDQAFNTAGLIGLTVFAASGDRGSSDGVADGLAHVDFPASDPNVVGCGGTRLVANGATIQSEVVWNDSSGSSGGGVSKFPLPSWQALANVPPSVNPGHNVGRGVPDVAGNADPATGYKCVIDGSAVTLGGTSAVAPLWAGLSALLDSGADHAMGFITPTLYQHSNLFRDITMGNNGAYVAKIGWDACTGWGSPNGPELAAFFAVPPMDVVGIAGGQLWHTIRNPDGTWVPAFGLVESVEQNNPGAFSAISCAGVGNQLQVVGIAGGQLWHTIRNPDGTWVPAFGLVESVEQNNPGAFSAISCAGVGNQLQLTGIAGGQLWHTIRNPDGSWVPAFGLVESVEQNNPGAFSAISCAGVAPE